MLSKGPDKALWLTCISVAAVPPACSLTSPSASKRWRVEEEDGDEKGWRDVGKRRACQGVVGREAEEEVRGDCGSRAPPGIAARLDCPSHMRWRCGTLLWMHVVNKQTRSDQVVFAVSLMTCALNKSEHLPVKGLQVFSLTSVSGYLVVFVVAAWIMEAWAGPVIPLCSSSLSLDNTGPNLLRHLVQRFIF